MSQAKTREPSSISKTPFLLALLLLLCSCAVAWFIWHEYEQMQESAQAAAKEAAALMERESFLKELLADAPCEAAQRYVEWPETKAP